MRLRLQRFKKRYGRPIMRHYLLKVDKDKEEKKEDIDEEAKKRLIHTTL